VADGDRTRRLPRPSVSVRRPRRAGMQPVPAGPSTRRTHRPLTWARPAVWAYQLVALAAAVVLDRRTLAIGRRLDPGVLLAGERTGPAETAAQFAARRRLAAPLHRRRHRVHPAPPHPLDDPGPAPHHPVPPARPRQPLPRHRRSAGVGPRPDPPDRRPHPDPHSQPQRREFPRPPPARPAHHRLTGDHRRAPDLPGRRQHPRPRRPAEDSHPSFSAASRKIRRRISALVEGRPGRFRG
jgi:hypothetical protein